MSFHNELKERIISLIVSFGCVVSTEEDDEFEDETDFNSIDYYGSNIKCNFLETRDFLIDAIEYGIDLSKSSDLIQTEELAFNGTENDSLEIKVLKIILETGNGKRWKLAMSEKTDRFEIVDKPIKLPQILSMLDKTLPIQEALKLRFEQVQAIDDKHKNTRYKGQFDERNYDLLYCSMKHN